VGPNSRVQWAKVYRTFLSERERNRSHIFPILDVLTHSQDIRDQSRMV